MQLFEKCKTSDHDTNGIINKSGFRIVFDCSLQSSEGIQPEFASSGPFSFFFPFQKSIVLIDNFHSSRVLVPLSICFVVFRSC